MNYSFQRLYPRQGDDIISSVRITVSDPEAPLSLTVDESYNMTVGGEAVEISAVTRFGVIRGNYYSLLDLYSLCRYGVI